MKQGQIIVTGASRGIGLAIAAELVARGREVVSLSRSGQGTAGRQVVCDMTDEQAVRRCIADIAAAGPIGALVNNAGMHIGGAASRVTVADFERIMTLNATAVMVAAREVHSYMRAHGGTIVNIGSLFDRIGVPGNLAYCASKAAVGAMTRVMAVEWAKYGIQTINVAPGYIETDLNRDYLAQESMQDFVKARIPAGGPGQPGDVARLVAALITEAIPFLNGETIYIDGAQNINH